MKRLVNQNKEISQHIKICFQWVKLVLYIYMYNFISYTNTCIHVRDMHGYVCSWVCLTKIPCTEEYISRQKFLKVMMEKVLV